MDVFSCDYKSIQGEMKNSPSVSSEKRAEEEDWTNTKTNNTIKFYKSEIKNKIYKQELIKQ